MPTGSEYRRQQAEDLARRLAEARRKDQERAAQQKKGGK